MKAAEGDWLKEMASFPGIVNLQLWVALGWLLEIFLVNRLVEKQLPKRWMWLLSGFLLLTVSRYLQLQPCMEGGLLALLSVWWAQKYLQAVYAGRKGQGFLTGCGVLAGLCFWLSPGTGLWLALGLGVFSLLHCFLHEREEKGVSYRLVSNPQVLVRWAKSWGLLWGLPWLLVCGLGVYACFNWPDLGLDWSIRFGDDFGYFAHFHWEFAETLQAQALQTRNAQGGWPLLADWMSRCVSALYLLVIGLLPLLGILGNGYILPNRFIYRLLRLEDEELLLYWVCSVAVVLSTLLNGTSAHLVSIGAVPFILGFLVLYRGVAKRPLAERRLWVLIAGFLMLLLLGDVAGILLHF